MSAVNNPAATRLLHYTYILQNGCKNSHTIMKIILRYILLSCGKGYVSHLDGYSETKPYRLPQYLVEFFNCVLHEWAVHRFECTTSRLEYLKQAYVNVRDRSGPFKLHVEQQIRKLDQLIAAEWKDVTFPQILILTVFERDEFKLELPSSEVLFWSIDSNFCRLLFSPLKCTF